MHTCGVILSGGKSSRMGRNKSLLTLGTKTIIEHIAEEIQTCTDEVIVIANEPSLYEFLNIDIFSDRYMNKGPLAGIEAAMYHKNADVFVITACDTPFISREVYKHLLNQLKSKDAAVPVHDDQLHPLSGVYKKDIWPKIQQQLDRNEHKVKGFFEHVQVNFVNNFGDISEELLQKHFFNMNNPLQYEQAKLL